MARSRENANAEIAVVIKTLIRIRAVHRRDGVKPSSRSRAMIMHPCSLGCAVLAVLFSILWPEPTRPRAGVPAAG
jgi:hypothetical protein